MATDELTEETIFNWARKLACAEARLEYLRQACGEDDDLRLRVSALLEAHEQETGVLSAPTALLATPLESMVEGPGVELGPYRLSEQIGEGGFGLVFRAEQQQPVRRTVALKVLKPGMDTRQVIARFEAERQALALMDHGNIARVLDAGETESGRPYFAMELVNGVPITSYCEQKGLATHDRLELFATVCQAVQHAHHKGIIHRDIKPSNVLVTLQDGVPVVKVIDFGIAKAIGQQLTDKTLTTSAAQLLGTPTYMSPEQAELGGLDVDTRSDIYSLGVLLYELLTGTTPFDKDRLRAASYDEMRRIIREEEPVKPSTRVRTLEQTATNVAQRRQREPARLSRLFRGELDWIAMKALEKERGRRYETAAAFAADIQRYLHDEPVAACPPSRWYRLRKLARRNKGVLLAAALVALALVAGTAVSVWQALRATAAMNSERRALLDLGEEQKATTRELGRTRDAEKKATLELFEALVAQARANRLSRRIGQRFETLALLRKATGMAQQMKLPTVRFLELRNEAIAALALPDLRVAKEWPDGSDGAVHFDSALSRYARVDLNGKLVVRRAADGKEIYRLPDLGPGDNWPLLSRDGGYLAVFEPGRSRLHVWRLAGAEPAEILDEPGLGAYMFSSDSRQLALQQADGSIGIFDLATRAKVQGLPPLPSVNQMRFHPAGGRLALVATGRFAQVRDLATGKVLWQKNLKDPWPSLAWHPHGKILAVADTDSISLWDVAKDKQVGKLENLGEGIGCTFNPDGTLLASVSWAGILRLWDPLGNRQLFSTPFAAVTFQFSADGRFLAGTRQGTNLRLWEIAAGHEYRTLVASPLQGKRRYRSVAISPEGRMLAAGAEGAGGVGLWDLSSGKELAFLKASAGINYVALEPRAAGASAEEKREGTLLTMGANGLFRWPISAKPLTGAIHLGPPQTLPVPGQNDGAIAQSQDGRVLASAQFQGGVVLHTDRPDQLIKLEPHQDVRHVAVSPDGQWVVTGGFGYPGRAKAWRARTGKLEKDLPAGAFCRPVFSPDGKRLLTSSVVAIVPVRRWEVETWAEMPFQEPIEGANAGFSPDGKLVVVETGAGVARLHDADTGREYARLEDPEQHRTNDFVFTPDGTKLACATGDGYCVHVWDLQAIRRQLEDLGLDWQ